MSILPVTPRDLNAVKALLRTCGLPFADLSTSHLTHFFMIKDTDRMVANVGLEVCGEFGLLRSLAVDPSSRGQGFGLQMVEHIESYARSQKVSTLYLLTTTADRFFSRLGYQNIPRAAAPAPLQATAEFQGICPDSAICMYKQL